MRKIFACHACAKGLMSKICIETLKLNNKTQCKMAQKT